MPNSNSITLYFREGKSDKVWRATFNQGVDFQNTAEYTVTFEWGRRGAAMQSKVKTFYTRLAAFHAYEQKVAEKLAKGYRQDTTTEDAAARQDEHNRIARRQIEENVAAERLQRERRAEANSRIRQCDGWIQSIGGRFMCLLHSGHSGSCQNGNTFWAKNNHYACAGCGIGMANPGPCWRCEDVRRAEIELRQTVPVMPLTPEQVRALGLDDPEPIPDTPSTWGRRIIRPNKDLKE